MPSTQSSADLEGLQEEIAQLKKRQQLLEDQLNFIKYKYHVQRSSIINHKIVDENKLINLKISYGDDLLAFSVRLDQKVVTLKKIIGDKTGKLILSIDLQLNKDSLNDAFTLEDYLVKDNDTLSMSIDESIQLITVDDKVHKLNNIQTFGQLKQFLRTESYITDDENLVIEDNCQIKDYESEFYTRRYKLNITFQSGDVKSYGFNDVSLLAKFRPEIHIPTNIQETLSKETTIDLKYTIFKIKLDTWDTKLKSIDNLDISKDKLKQILGIKTKKNNDIQVLDKTTGLYKDMDDSLKDSINYDTELEEVIVLRLQTHIDVAYRDKSITLSQPSKDPEAWSLAIGHSRFLIHKKNKTIVCPGETITTNMILTDYKISVYDFNEQLQLQAGIDELHDSSLTIESYLLSLDDLLFDKYRDILYAERSPGGPPFFIEDPAATYISTLIKVMNQRESHELVLKLFKRLDVIRISKPNVKLVYGYNVETTVQMLKDYILQFLEQDHTNEFLLLYCKKSAISEVSIDLQRYFNYELLYNCNLDRDFDLIFFEMSNNENKDPDNPTYVVNYNKDDLTYMFKSIMRNL